MNDPHPTVLTARQACQNYERDPGLSSQVGQVPTPPARQRRPGAAVPLPFVNGLEETYEEVGAKRVAINGNGWGM